VTTPRIFSPEILREGHRVDLERENSQYIQNVLRLKMGDVVSLFDGRGSEHEAAITELSEGIITVEIGAKKRACLPDLKVTLAQSLPKGSKMDFIIQKSTELGVDRIIPFMSSRSIPRLSERKAVERRKRWERIAVEACRQCGRARIPEIRSIVTFEEMLEAKEEESLGILLWEDETERGIKELLRDKRYGDSGDFFVIVGPEGGFSREEAERAIARDFISASLGSLILRAETAPLAILTILQYEKGSFGQAEKGAL